MENNSQAAYALRDYGVIWEDGPDRVFDKIINSKMMGRWTELNPDVGGSL
jgi:hypothetical protein